MGSSNLDPQARNTTARHDSGRPNVDAQTQITTARCDLLGVCGPPPLPPLVVQVRAQAGGLGGKSRAHHDPRRGSADIVRHRKRHSEAGGFLFLQVSFGCLILCFGFLALSLFLSLCLLIGCLPINLHSLHKQTRNN